MPESEETNYSQKKVKKQMILKKSKETNYSQQSENEETYSQLKRFKHIHPFGIFHTFCCSNSLSFSLPMGLPQLPCNAIVGNPY